MKKQMILAVMAACVMTSVWAVGGTKSLIAAIRVADLDFANDMLVKFPDIADDLLTDAVRQGNLGLVNLIFTKFPDIELNKNIGFGAVRNDDWSGNTLLTVAAEKGYAGIATVLLEHGVAPDSTNWAGKTALMIAAAKGRTDVATTLLEHGARSDLVRFESFGDMDPALIIAVAYGSAGVVATLLEHGVDPNLQTIDGETALIIASKYGYANIATILLEHGANPNYQQEDRRLRRVLHDAYGFVRTDFAAFEAYQNTPVEHTDWTALMIAANYGRADVVTTLLKYGANPNLQKGDGETALIIASKNGDANIVAALLTHPEININKHTGWGYGWFKAYDHAKIKPAIKKLFDEYFVRVAQAAKLFKLEAQVARLIEKHKWAQAHELLERNPEHVSKSEKLKLFKEQVYAKLAAAGVGSSKGLSETTG